MNESWFEPIDIYCERVAHGFWEEPLNAISNAAFLIAALVVWRITGREGRRDGAINGLLLILAAIGTGSFLFHTFADQWSLLADVIPIALFICVYLYFATTRLAGGPIWLAALFALAFTPASGVVSAGIEAVIGSVNGSVGYFPVVLAIVGYAIFFMATGRNGGPAFLVGAGILIASLFFRSIDMAVCDALPIGIHYMWHTLNGIMLGWMILALARGGALRGGNA